MVLKYLSTSLLNLHENHGKRQCQRMDQVKACFLYRKKIRKNQKERKDAVTRNIRSFFGGSTIVKSSVPLNSKEKKIIKID